MTVFRNAVAPATWPDLAEIEKKLDGLPTTSLGSPWPFGTDGKSVHARLPLLTNCGEPASWPPYSQEPMSSIAALPLDSRASAPPESWPTEP